MDTGSLSMQQHCPQVNQSAPVRQSLRNRVSQWAVCLMVTTAMALPSTAQENLNPIPKAAPAAPESVSPAVPPAVSPAATEPVLVATEPVLVVTLGSLNKLMQDINYITGAVGQPQMGGIFTMMAGTFAQGLDMTQPIGVLVPLVDGVPQPIAVLPTSDVKSILKRLEAQTGPADELPDGTLVVSVGANMIFIRQKESWAVLAPQKELLDLAPADPTTLFEGMGNEYDLAFRVKLQQVPADTRNVLIGQLRQGFEQAMEKRSGADAEKTRELAEGSMEQLEQFINETDELNFGLNIDQAGKEVVVDTTFTAVDGTELASMYAGTHAIPSQFASVIRDDAAAYYHAATSISPEAIEKTRTTLRSALKSFSGMLENEDGLSPDQAKDLTTVIDQVGDLAIKSVEEGRADLGAMLLTGDDGFQFVFGSFVANGDDAAQIIRDVAAKLESEPDAPRFEFDRSTYQGVKMHLIEKDVPESEDEARKLFGEKLQVHVGTGDKSVYVAVGKNSEALLKELIDKQDGDTVGDRPIGQFLFKLLPVLQYANSIESNDAIASMIDELTRSPDSGVIKVIQDSIENGQSSKITIGEGLLRAIGAAAQQAQRAKMQGQF